jgi:cytochrome P450
MDTQEINAAPARQLSTLRGPRPLPFLGNLLQTDLEQMHLRFEEWARRHGGLYVFWMGPKPVLIVSNTELSQKILRDRPRGFRRMSPIEAAMREIRAHGLFSAEGDDWTRQRRLVMAAFNTGHMRACHDQIAAITRRLEQVWRGAAERGEPVDLLQDLMRYTVDVTCAVAFGVDMRTVDQGTHPLQRNLEVLFGAINRRVLVPFPYWRYVKLPADRAVDRAIPEVERVIRELIQEARAEMARDPARAASPRNLLEAMLAARDVEDPAARLSDQEVYGNVLTTLLAGEDTTSSSIAWMLYYMAKQPEVQARVREEADRELGEAEVPRSPEQSQRLAYIAAVAQETLRLKSAAPLIYLESLKDTVIGDVAVPAGTWVIVLTRILALKDENFRDPTVFDPSRWLEAAPSSSGRHEPRAALAFGGGPRICPGRALALLECSMVGAMVARRFEVSFANAGVRVDERLDFTMEPKNLRVRFARRERAQRG